ncbi:carbon-nitrogen hydrolase family protein (plasmid) [Arthrobacter sp. UC242_113]|uniref:carbon-nitrogen hydrolase family protein n=1 Tax=Arthrobacter sp. UC242_113 TaxID=3374550 RepID=UPI003756E83E
MLLALLQENSIVLDTVANCAAIESAARAAAAGGADLLVTPELFPVGYAPLQVRSELDPRLLPSLHNQLAGIAKKHHIGLVYSLPRVTETGEWQISATLVDAEGTTLLDYGKVHLFGPAERNAFTPAGNRPAVVEFHGISLSMMICYDVEFPESVRAAAMGGAELLLVPTALGHGFDDVPQVLVRARALESQLAIAYANHSGVEDGNKFLGGSVIAGPDGKLLASASEGPTLLLATIDPEAVKRERRTVPYLDERRADLYQVWEADHNGTTTPPTVSATRTNRIRPATH